MEFTFHRTTKLVESIVKKYRLDIIPLKPASSWSTMARVPNARSIMIRTSTIPVSLDAESVSVLERNGTELN
jgi:hypothetical protein